MQHLARICHTKTGEETTLQSLAYMVDDYLWRISDSDRFLTYSSDCGYGEGVLILAEVDDSGQVVHLDEATDWVLGIVTQFLSQGLSPDALKQEVERAEQWRQSLTLQSQEIRRRILETAARRDEIQELEKKLRLEQSCSEEEKGNT